MSIDNHESGEHKVHTSGGALGNIVSEMKNKIVPILPEKSRVAFRRIMFQSQFDLNTSKLLDDLCLDFFMQTTGWFDEIIIIQKINEEYHPVYDYSMREKQEDPIEEEEFIKLAHIGNALAIGDWSWVDSAGGSDFDMVGKINDNFLVCVNNTNASIDELETIFPNRIFEEVKPVIERTIAMMKGIIGE